MYELELNHTTHTGHRIPNHQGGAGKCARLHGHTYTFTVKIAGDVLDPATGFLLDFGAIKSMLDEWDHRLLLWDNDPVRVSITGTTGSLSNGSAAGCEDEGDAVDELLGVLYVPFVPTAECMAEHLAERFLACEGVYFSDVTVHETEKSAARFACSKLDDLIAAAITAAGGEDESAIRRTLGLPDVNA